MAHQKISKINPEQLMATARANEDQFIQQLRTEKKRDTKLGLLTSIAPALQEWRAKGLSYKEIAALLAHSGLPVSPQTIKAAMERILQRDSTVSQPQTLQSDGEANERKPDDEANTGYQIPSAVRDEER